MLVAISFSPSREAVATVPSSASNPEHARFVGAMTCQSSMCHGGASPLRCQYTIWSHDDAHARAYATLVSDYGINIAKAAGIASPTTDARCVACHAPLAMPSVDLAPTANVIEGVTCESCHNSAAEWLRSHTRPDFTYFDRVHAGMRNLRDTYVRADTCVKCHQVISPGLVKAGHPTLTFELDGQAASEPRHWMEKDSWFGAKAWLVGQLVALRDVAAEYREATKQPGNPNTPALRQQLTALEALLFVVPSVSHPEGMTPLVDLDAWATQEAQRISAAKWTDDQTRVVLTALARQSDNYRNSKDPQADLHVRAQRLVLALDRLLKATHPIPQANPLKPPVAVPPLPGDAELGVLFNEVQDPSNFDPKKFADSLQKFADVVSPTKN